MGNVTIEVKIAKDDGPHFLEGIYIQRDIDTGCVIIGIENNRGEAYASSSLSKEQFVAVLNALGISVNA